ncbi:MAG TPA: rRNA maturation RNase YbeY [Candidatus Saccharimonadales bacterium]|nr:rRNA maturation RNase YbeY [Candidatus Saccharimonadales bacterium]
MTNSLEKKDIHILFFVESRYKVDRKRIRKLILQMLQQNDVKGPVEVSLAIVGDRKMREISRKYKGDDKTRNILSFPLSEGPSSMLPTDKLRLGDIVISYPEVIRESAKMDKMVDDRVEELMEHGMNHLLGLHHE